MLKACLDEKYGVLNAARSTMGWQKDWATRVSFSEAPWRFGRWGWYFLADISSYDLVLAATLVPAPEREAFLQAACFNADQEFGNSAGDVVSITGIGVKRPVDHVHQISRFSGLVEPVPGIPLGFHPAGYNRGNNWRSIMASYMLGELPAAYRYVDCWNIEQEFTVQVLGPTLMTYAMLADPAAQKSGRPDVRVLANGRTGAITGNAPFQVEFRAEAKGANGKAIRDTYWDLSNEETAADPSFTYTFTVPGLYPVVCSVTDEDGWMAYQRVVVCVAQPSGQVVRVHGPDDGVRIKLPDRLLNDPSFQSVRVEVLVNYEKDTAWGEGPSNLLAIDCNYNTKLGLCKIKWTGKSLYGIPGEDLKGNAWRPIAETRPGWMKWALGFDRSTGKSYLESAHGRVEFPYTPGPAKNENFLDIGGFIGFLDEVRILVSK